MKYFHDEETQTVYAVGEIVARARRETKTKRRPNPRVLGYDVSQETQVTSAGNWIDPATNRWHAPVFFHERESYDDRDSEELAIMWFRKSHFGRGSGNEITQAEYELLHVRYEAMAKANKPSKA
jgi:hypothetical protein